MEVEDKGMSKLSAMTVSATTKYGSTPTASASTGFDTNQADFFFYTCTFPPTISHFLTRFLPENF